MFTKQKEANAPKFVFSLKSHKRIYVRVNFEYVQHQLLQITKFIHNRHKQKKKQKSFMCTIDWWSGVWQVPLDQLLSQLTCCHYLLTKWKYAFVWVSVTVCVCVHAESHQYLACQLKFNFGSSIPQSANMTIVAFFVGIKLYFLPRLRNFVVDEFMPHSCATCYTFWSMWKSEIIHWVILKTFILNRGQNLFHFLAKNLS